MASRRSTRARTSSQEPVLPVQIKTKTSKRQQAMAAIPESPAKASSKAFSGTATHDLVRTQPAMVDRSERLIDGLGDLWDTSEQLLKKILPDSITLESLEDLKTRLQNAPRQRKDFAVQYQKLKDAMQIYPETPINVTTTCRDIFDLGKDSELPQGPHRPDDILYKANLAYVLGILAEQLVSGIDDCDCHELLQFFIQSLFSRVLKSNERASSGSTSIFKPTFELALELQTQAYIADLLDQITDGESLPDPIDTVTKTFYKEDGSTLLGWNVQGLQAKQLSKSQRDAIAHRVATIGQLVQNLEGDPNLEELQAEFPMHDLILRFFLWAKDRNAELTEKIDSVPGGSPGIQEAIDNENARRQGQGHTEDNGEATLNAKFAKPVKPVKNKASLKKELYNAMRASTSLSRPQSSAAHSVVVASPSNTKKRQSHATNQIEETLYDPPLFVGDDDEDQPEEGDRISEPAKKGIDPSTAVDLAQAVMAQDLRANKENRPESSYINAQPNNQDSTQVTSHDAAGLDRSTISKGKRPREQVQDDGDQGVTETYNDDQLSQDTGFETQIAPSSGPTKRRRLGSSTTAVGTSSTSNIIAPSAPSHVLKPRQPTETPLAQESLSSQIRRQANEISKELAAKIKAQRPPQKRKPWSAAEIEHLEYLMTTYGKGWSVLKQLDEQCYGGILKDRGQVALKDKARNIKMDFLKAGKPVPPYLHLVPVKASDMKALQNMQNIASIAVHSQEHDE